MFRVGDVVTTSFAHGETYEDNTQALDVVLFDLSAPVGSQLLYSSVIGPDGENEVLPANIRSDESIAVHFGLLELTDPDNRIDYFFFDYGFRSYVLKVSASDATFATNYRTPIISALAIIILSIVTAIAVSTTRARFRIRNEFVVELNRLIETAGVPILGMKGTSEVNLWNTNIAELTGIPQDLAIGKLNMTDVIVPEDAEMARKVVRSVYETGEPVTGVEVGVRSISGAERRVIFSCTPRYGLDGKLSGVFVIGQDITESVAATAELTRVSGDLTRIIETANAPIFGVDVDGNVNEWNANVSEITGYSRDEILGKNFVSMLISAEHQSSVNEVLELALSGEQTANYESPIRTRDGRTVQILLNASTRRDDAGNIVGVIGIGQDITERVETADDRNRLLVDKADLVRRLLESQEEERGSIAYDLHDGPAQHLSGASMFLESYVAIKDEIDSAERDLMISTAKGYVGSALEEIQRIMAGLRPSALDDLGLVQGLRESVREVARRTGRKIEFFTEMDENIEVAAAAEIVLYRISQEAVSNAVKHSVTGTISVELSDSNGALVLKVTDRGTGFDVDAVMNSPEKRGMGLLGMHERAELIGADLSVDSEIGEGTTVTITLPDSGKLEAKSD